MSVPFAICVALALGGCDKGEAGAGTGGATASKSPAAAEAEKATTPAAAPAPAAPASKCPAGMPGVGTPIDPCVATGSKRWIELSYGRKDEEGMSQFTMKNVSNKPIGNASFYTFFYDKGGTQVLKDNQKAFVGRAGELRATLEPGASATVALDPPKAKWPENTATIEAEAVMVRFADGTWMKNMDLIKEGRPKGGLK